MLHDYRKSMTERAGWRSWYRDWLRLDGPGIETLWGREFPHVFRPALGPKKLPVQRVLGLSWG